MQSDEWRGKIYASRFNSPTSHIAILATRNQLTLRVFDRLHG